MLNLIQKFFTTIKSDKTLIRKNFSQFFYSQPEHAWIREAKITGHFDNLFSHLPIGVIEALMTKYPIVFIKSEDLKQHQRMGMPTTNTIVIFPEFQKLLLTKKTSAIAYLAHELAFVLYEFEGHRNDPMMAEIEADKFVCDLGLTFELEELLLMLDETVEKRLRLTYLTINHFTNGHN
ncbi:MAG TPA: hypothetical protein VNJ01_06080 [Bacteriovoracaceae bacterium]|nr:hypothetical protein [Bacteriovoracaceae bacterium]